MPQLKHLDRVIEAKPEGTLADEAVPEPYTGDAFLVQPGQVKIDAVPFYARALAVTRSLGRERCRRRASTHRRWGTPATTTDRRPTPTADA